jgi:hypothetical protein
MKLSEFILLGEPLKKHAVLHDGVLIGKRKTTVCMVFLFQMDNYYVETYCHLESKAVTEYRAFRSGKSLHPYLELIDIKKLLKE